eukprot:6202485-Pleurochrysis_carterae.AAC.1
MSVGVAVVLLVFFRCAGPLCLVGSGVYALSLVTGHAVLRGMVASVGNTARVAVGVEALFYVSCCVFATVVSRTAAQPPHLSRSRRREIWRALLEDPHFSVRCAQHQPHAPFCCMRTLGRYVLYTRRHARVCALTTLMCVSSRVRTYGRARVFTRVHAHASRHASSHRPSAPSLQTRFRVCDEVCNSHLEAD